jgi:CheY-like chemotaxis protein
MTQKAHISAILIVEDEALVRMIAVDILSSLDVVLYEASDADEALFELAAHPAIDILFTDVDMPGGMDGMELARRMYRARPEMGIIVTSGKHHISSTALPGCGTFLPKPYRADQLRAAVAQKLALAA